MINCSKIDINYLEKTWSRYKLQRQSIKYRWDFRVHCDISRLCFYTEPLEGDPRTLRCQQNESTACSTLLLLRSAAVRSGILLGTVPAEPATDVSRRLTTAFRNPSVIGWRGPAQTNALLTKRVLVSSFLPLSHSLSSHETWNLMFWRRDVPSESTRVHQCYADAVKSLQNAE